MKYFGNIKLAFCIFYLLIAGAIAIWVTGVGPFNEQFVLFLICLFAALLSASRISKTLSYSNSFEFVHCVNVATIFVASAVVTVNIYIEKYGIEYLIAKYFIVTVECLLMFYFFLRAVLVYWASRRGLR